MQTHFSHHFPHDGLSPLAVNPIQTMAETIEETVIVSDRVNTSSQSLAVSVIIDRALMEALGSVTLPQLLKTQVGISTTQTGGLGAVSGIRVRGQDTRTKVLLDGVDINDHRHRVVLAWSMYSRTRSIALRCFEVRKGYFGVRTPVALFH